MNRLFLILLGTTVAALAALLTFYRPGPRPRGVPDKPRRIASMTLATSEILLELVPRERIAAMHEIAGNPLYSMIADRIEGIPLLPSDAERLIAVNPDLVLVASYSRKGFVEQLEYAGLPVRRFTRFHDVEDVIADVRRLGRLVGEPERAEALVRRMRSELRKIRSRIPRDAVPPRVLSLDSGGWTAGSETTFDALLRLAKARNVAAEHGVVGFARLSAEQVVAWNPGILVTPVDPSAAGSIRERIRSDPAYAPLRDCRIIEMPCALFTTVSHYIVEALRFLVEALYP